jgi:hypothetical protein
MTEEELCIDLIRRIVGILAPYALVAQDRKAACSASTVGSSVVEDRGQRHGGEVEDVLIRLAWVLLGPGETKVTMEVQGAGVHSKNDRGKEG